ASILKLDPDWYALPVSTPVAIRKLAQRCLTRDRNQRLQAIGEARIVIEQQLANPGNSLDDALLQAGAQRSAWNWIMAVVPIAMALALGIVSFLHFREARPQERVLRYSIVTPGDSVNTFAVSPDARYVAIAAQLNGRRQLWLQPLDTIDAQPLPG